MDFLKIALPLYRLIDCEDILDKLIPPLNGWEDRDDPGFHGNSH